MDIGERSGDMGMYIPGVFDILNLTPPRGRPCSGHPFQGGVFRMMLVSRLRPSKHLLALASFPQRYIVGVVHNARTSHQVRFQCQEV